MKRKLLFLLFILLIPWVFSEVECSKVFVVKFNYDDGIITYRDKVIKCGYAPDRRIQPEEGYIAEILSVDNDVLYSFRFEVPLKINFDSSDPIVNRLSGGMLILNETDFALIFPYYDGAKAIVINNPREYKVLEVPLIEEKFIKEKTSWLWILLVLVLLIISGYLIYKHFKKPKQPTRQQYYGYYQR